VKRGQGGERGRAGERGKGKRKTRRVSEEGE